MEALPSSSLAVCNPRCPPRFSSFPSPSIFSSQAPSFSTPPLIPPLCFKTCFKSQPLHPTQSKGRSWTALRSSATESSLLGSSERWLLEPVGDGDSRHIGYRVPMPGAFEIASNAVTVGRLPEKADVVIPVATVSALHARLERKNGTLLVTDLDSTNGTYIDEKKLKPGAVTAVSPGSRIIFGDTHLAMFRVSKVEVDVTSEADESQTQEEAPIPADNLETTS